MADVWEAVARWARTFVGAYVLSVVGVVAVTAASLTGRGWVLVPGFVVLGLAASRLHEVVRLEGDDGRRRRVVVALAQLGVGALVVALAWTGSVPGADPAFLLGIALAILAAGALVGELRGLPGSEPVRPPTIVVAILAMGLGATVVAALVWHRWWLVFAALVVLLVGVVVVDLRIRSASWWGRRPGAALLVAAMGLLLLGPLADGPWFVGIVLAGIVAGELGTELLSEDSHRWQGGWAPRALTLGAGVVLLFAAGLLSVGMGAETSHVILLLLGLAVVATLASSDSDSLILVGLVMLALIWTATPPTSTTDRRDAPPEIEPGDRYFLVLGDSYMSGEGAEEFLAGTNTTEVDEDDYVNECRRAPTAWALRLARYRSNLEGVIPARALFLACSGAVAANIDTEPRIEEGGRLGPAELDLFRRYEDRLGQPEFVLIQVGGNDARFGDIGPACIGPGNCAALGQQFLDDLAGIGDDLDAAYQRIQAEVDDDVPIIAVPYPIPLSATNVCDDVLLNGDEQAFVVGFVTQLNLMVASAAKRNGLLYMETMEGALRNSGTMLCDESGLRAGINFLAFNPKEGRLSERLDPTNWTHNSLHPNAAGHEALHDTAVVWFEANELTVPEPEPDHRHQVPPLDEVLTDRRQIPQCEASNRTSCETDGYAWHLDQLRESYWGDLVVLTPAMIGAWLVLAWPMWIARDRGISLAKVVRGTLRREPRPPREGG